LSLKKGRFGACEKARACDSYEPIPVCRVSALATLPKQEKESKLQKLRDEAKKLHETYYDSGFAWNNHYTLLGGEDQFSDNPDDNECVYCSELVYKAFDRAFGIKLGTVHKIKDYPLTDTAKKILDYPRGQHCRGEKDFDPNEDAIAPQDIFKSPELEKVKVD
jgi:Permuted papain-like amidase enzyme, YaeF/YiiX, C92 family